MHIEVTWLEWLLCGLSFFITGLAAGILVTGGVRADEQASRLPQLESDEDRRLIKEYEDLQAIFAEHGNACSDEDMRRLGELQAIFRSRELKRNRELEVTADGIDVEALIADCRKR